MAMAGSPLLLFVVEASRFMLGSSTLAGETGWPAPMRWTRPGSYPAIGGGSPCSALARCAY